MRECTLVFMIISEALIQHAWPGVVLVSSISFRSLQEIFSLLTTKVLLYGSSPCRPVFLVMGASEPDALR